MPADFFRRGLLSGCPDDNENSNSVLVVRKSETYIKRPLLTCARRRRRGRHVLSRVRIFGLSVLQDVDNCFGQKSASAFVDKIEGEILCRAYKNICLSQTCPWTSVRPQERHYTDRFVAELKRKS